jgi:acyl-CoA reductase-like NAD-dependent aldehyde dehydrogenase
MRTEAAAIANGTNNGLTSYVFWSDPTHAWAIAARLQAGRLVTNRAAHDPLGATSDRP